jgi:mannose/cellobiose epimerase-like protein (N-acyl-D-glucosamine 2-epimerase family)
MHWVTAEAISAAAALHIRTGDNRYAECASRWWTYVEDHLIDPERGSWFHQLSPANEVLDTVWPGKPDLYHAVQTTLIPRLPLAPGIAAALKTIPAAGPT